jgi:flagellar basal-body rod protein FlgF
MDRLIYLSSQSAKANYSKQDTLANNLANVSTPGFRAELQATRSVPVVGGYGASTRAYAVETTPGYDSNPGVTMGTGRNLDVAMGERSWLALQARDGTEAYTRNGSLDVAEDGTLTTRSGLAVVGEGGPITVPLNSAIKIGADGTVTARVGQEAPQIVGRLKMVTPEAPLERGTDGLFRSPQGDLAADPQARLQDGALEMSNVNPIETMVGMIAANRQYEAQMKMVSNAEANDRSSSRLLSTTQ